MVDFLKLLIGSAAAVGGVLLAIPAAGFTAAGVAAGSLAAFWQSLIGNVGAGTLFAILQSVGVIGLGKFALSVIATIGATIAAFFF